ncbi:hypothetical protein PPL19_23147 [Pseudomonas psychrotolerans L19]|uniref:hypothetical protein n=1 Tax=Pseudomonas oryzihabitans TaxID=47885 RepID=UPI00023A3076|nr:hypothetical protein [Pseudomonas psychrotolerans]EHK68643.1 hypothetical protein PPL19_23147 [Pseudomonas psychrotolerans L19]
MVIERDYLPSKPKAKPFPRALASRIARKADIMAKRFEEQAIHEMTKAARAALNRDVDLDEIARQLQL